MDNGVKPNRRRDDTAAIVAKMFGVTEDYVRKVRNGDREDEEILATIIEFEQGKNNLIKAIEKMIPIGTKSPRYVRN